MYTCIKKYMYTCIDICFKNCKFVLLKQYLILDFKIFKTTGDLYYLFVYCILITSELRNTYIYSDDLVKTIFLLLFFYF